MAPVTVITSPGSDAVCVDRVVEGDLPEMVEERSHLEISDFGSGKPELFAIGRSQRGDRARRAGRNHAAELRAIAKLRSSGGTSASRSRGVRTPYQAASKGVRQQRSPQTENCRPRRRRVPIANQHPRRRDRQTRRRRLGSRRCTELGTPCCGDVDHELRTRGGRERDEVRRDLLASTDEMPCTFVRGVVAAATVMRTRRW